LRRWTDNIAVVSAGNEGSYGGGTGSQLNVDPGSAGSTDACNRVALVFGVDSSTSIAVRVKRTDGFGRGPTADRMGLVRKEAPVRCRPDGMRKSVTKLVSAYLIVYPARSGLFLFCVGLGAS
jgi:hypothetical protein